MAISKPHPKTKGIPIAFPFVVEELDSRQPIIKAMFGCHAVYVNEKLMLILRNRPSHPEDNGVWIATNHEHHRSLKEEFTSLRTIKLLGTSATAWQNLPSDNNDFENDAIRICQLILRNDHRIGKIPKSWKKKGNQ